MLKHDDAYYLEKTRQYVDDGFCVVENVLPTEFLERVRTVCYDHLKTVSDEHREAQRSTGSLIDLSAMPELAELIAFPGALEAYRRMGFDDVRYTTGYLISKPPKSPPLFWHFDWMGWAHPLSYEKAALQTFFMYYLVDTTPENGCLKVIPRSHIDEHPLHKLIEDAHSPELRVARDLTAPEFASHPNEVNVCVKAGDLVIGDSRLIHGSHPNDSDLERPVLTLWMHPNFGDLPGPLQAFCYSPNMWKAWPNEARQ
ncbi:MAG: phytanoyl-CoA dioxygenase family protein, partial [Lentisphaeria bacterium]|nr:phytanoyl-CoA dioxygenase family protein [Lentisphaeria bacterium]